MAVFGGAQVYVPGLWLGCAAGCSGHCKGARRALLPLWPLPSLSPGVGPLFLLRLFSFLLLSVTTTFHLPHWVGFGLFLDCCQPCCPIVVVGRHKDQMNLLQRQLSTQQGAGCRFCVLFLLCSISHLLSCKNAVSTVAVSNWESDQPFSWMPVRAVCCAGLTQGPSAVRQHGIEQHRQMSKLCRLGTTIT